ncbi:MAG: hypothetical protein M1541_03140, partial [Acidobacteria bacterium]|nr:hypothetical protein [Acidobacteriota bacterium]
MARKAGNTATVTTSIERRALDGGLEVAEKDTRTTSQKGDTTHTESVIYRRDTSGNFYAAEQTVALVEKPHIPGAMELGCFAVPEFLEVDPSRPAAEVLEEV